MINWSGITLSGLVILLQGCYLEVGGCTGNVCVHASENVCDEDDCHEEKLYCEDSLSIEQRMADIISETRSRSRQCGNQTWDNTDQVFWNTTLARAAQLHSSDMARHNFLSHTGSDGSDVGQRAENAGYDYRRIAENIAGGQKTASEVVNAWLESSGHCANIMNPALMEIGAACVQDDRTEYTTYWTLILASPSSNQ